MLNFSAFMLLIILAPSLLISSMVVCKKEVTLLLNWMASLEYRTHYFRSQAYRSAILKASIMSLKTIRILTCLIIIACISISVLTVLFEYFVRGKEWYLPLKSYLPYLAPTNIIFYLINSVQQTYAVVTICCYTLAYNSFLFCCMIYQVANLQAIEELVGHMDEGIAAGDFYAWLKLISREIYDAKM